MIVKNIYAHTHTRTNLNTYEYYVYGKVFYLYQIILKKTYNKKKTKQATSTRKSLGQQEIVIIHLSDRDWNEILRLYKTSTSTICATQMQNLRYINKYESSI